MLSRKKIILLAAALVILALLIPVYLLTARLNTYQRLLGYQVDADYRYDFSRTEALQVPVEVSAQGFIWPKVDKRWDTGFLKLSLGANLLGQAYDPYIEVNLGGERFRQYCERGAKGVRYLNISPLAHAGLKAGAQVALKGRYLSWTRQQGTLILFHNKLSPKSRVLVIAPHPDDAEIAAFGLYSFRDSYVATLTAGEAGLPTDDPFEQDKQKLHLLTGKLRVWDSITIPYWGGLGPSRTCNLGYFDKTLEWMFKHPDQQVKSPFVSSSDTSLFRRCTWASLAKDKRAKATWKNLVNDLAAIIKDLKPDIIVTPHPLLDQHPDHRYATVAVLQAMREAKITSGDLFLYTNHFILTEIYPFGHEESLISLPPWFDATWLFSRVYSHQLIYTRQIDKYFALEAMHDLRSKAMDMAGPAALLNKDVEKSEDELLGMDNIKSYFRRAVRPNEIFFVVPAKEAEAMENEALAALGNKPRTAAPPPRPEIKRPSGGKTAWRPQPEPNASNP